MKRILIFFMTCLLILGCVSACGGSSDRAESRKLTIVAAIFPEYDWVMNILGDDAPDADVTMLMDKGVDMHSFQPSAADILKISACDLFLYVGGTSDRWVEDVLKEAVNKDMVVLNLLEMLGDAVKEEEIIEGMQKEDHDHGEDLDEHVWLSLRNASVLVTGISEALQKIDPDRAEAYKKNTLAYLEKLEALDNSCREAVSEADVKTVLFGDRFPFRYLVDDYGLSYYAAFAGCSAETEASFETITFLSRKADELSLRAVLTIEGNDHRIAETIVRNTKTKDQKILTMDSMQSVTSKDVQNGTTYLSVMEKNIEVLKEALR